MSFGPAQINHIMKYDYIKDITPGTRAFLKLG